MLHLDPSSSFPSNPEHLRIHFDCLLAIVKRVAPLHVSLYEHTFSAVPPEGWVAMFGRHRARLRFRYIPQKGMTVQQADAPSSEWYPDWETVKSEIVDWPERQSNEYEAMERVLLERFAV
jgi:hypothetical protein